MRYYSAQNEFGYDYCEAMQSMEASTKYILPRFPIDEILVIGEDASSEGEDNSKPFRLRVAGALQPADSALMHDRRIDGRFFYSVHHIGFPAFSARFGVSGRRQKGLGR